MDCPIEHPLERALSDSLFFQKLVISCSEPYRRFPTIRLHYLLPDNSPALIRLALPTPISKFVEGRHLDAEDFFRFWKDEEFILKEGKIQQFIHFVLLYFAICLYLYSVVALIHLDRKRYRRSRLLVAKAIQLVSLSAMTTPVFHLISFFQNGALRLLPSIDPSPNNLAFAGIFPPAKAAVDIPTSLVLVRYVTAHASPALLPFVVFLLAMNPGLIDIEMPLG